MPLFSHNEHGKTNTNLNDKLCFVLTQSLIKNIDEIMVQTGKT